MVGVDRHSRSTGATVVRLNSHEQASYRDTAQIEPRKYGLSGVPPRSDLSPVDPLRPALSGLERPARTLLRRPEGTDADGVR